MVVKTVAVEGKIQTSDRGVRKPIKSRDSLESLISVVVCTKNAVGTIGQCLESVKRNYPSEMIVVDGGSTDGTVEIAKRYTDRIYFDNGIGLADARQLGAEKAAASYIFYVDSDVILPRYCLRTMMDELKVSDYTGIHAQVIGLRKASYWAWAEDQHFRMRFNKEGEAKSIGTIACIYEKDSILEHEFDPFFVNAAEDGDLCYRLRKNGLRLGISSAFVYHEHRATVRSFIKQRVGYGRGNARFFWKHKSATTLLGTTLMIPFGILVCIRNRSLRMLPYYLIWSAAGTYGTLREMVALTFRKLRATMPKRPSAEYAKAKPQYQQR